MRHYDRKTGTRFDMNHPAWITGMKTKAGKVRSRMDWANALELQAAGMVDLRPSVTEIAKVADGFGIFGPASQWGMQSTLDVYSEWLSTAAGDGLHIGIGTLKGLAQKRMSAPADKGSELHDAYHNIRLGILKLDGATEDQQKFYAACVKALEQVGIGTDHETEVQFVNDNIGGTCDLNAKTSGLDWKTVQKFRQPRTSELLQVGAYADHFGWSEAWIVYVHQTSFEYRILKFTEKGGEGTVSLAKCIPVFYQALDLHNGISSISIPAIGV